MDIIGWQKLALIFYFNFNKLGNLNIVSFLGLDPDPD
jgi:hypothetical protein